MFRSRKIIDFELYFQYKYDYFISSTPVSSVLHLNGYGLTAAEYEIFGRYRPKTLIDIGSSNGGRYFGYLLDSGINVIGIEKHSKLIEEADSRWKDRLICADITEDDLNLEQLGFRDKVDMITTLCFAFGGIHRKQDRLAVLQLISDFLRPGGYFVMDNYNYAGFQSNPVGRHIKVATDIPAQYFPSRSEIKSQAEEYGLELVRDWSVPAETKYEVDKVYLIFQKQ